MSAPKHDDGGPAFPVPMAPLGRPDEFSNVLSSGMSLRDWFAGEALRVSVYTTACRRSTSASLIDQLEPPTSAEVAAAAYLIADAMLAERVKEK